VDARRFQFSLSVPRDAQFAPMVRGLAAQAARYASCSEAEVEAFAGSVDAAVRACLRESSADAIIAITVQRDAGPIEVLVNGRAITVQP
jgi:hypothetical protein